MVERRTRSDDSADGPAIGKRQRTIRQCLTCAKTFTKQDHLDRHIRSHTKERPYECTHCGKSYGRNDTLARHIRDQHEVKQSSISADEPTHSQANLSEGNGFSSAWNGPDSNITGMRPDAAIETSDALPPGSEHQWTDPMAPQAGFGNNFQLDPEIPFPPWLIDESFDDFSDLPFINPTIEVDQSLEAGQSMQPQNDFEPLGQMREIWYTNFKNSRADRILSGVATPTSRLQSVQVDEEYRRSLQSKLQIKPIENRLPSTDVLNLCIDAYFKYFHPIFPVIHVPTFRPSKARAVLLISISSIGSLFTGSPGGFQQGIYIFEHLHKAMVAKWEGILSEGDDEALAAVQAALLGQTFGFLSGEPKHLALVDAFHGTVISWARRRKIFSAKHKSHNQVGLSDQQLGERWKEWAKTEECLRVALALSIHDGELAAIFHHEPLLRYSPTRVPISASFSVFEAPNAHDWRRANSAEYPGIHGRSSSIPTPSFDFGSLSSPEASSVFLDGFQQRLEDMPRSSYLSIYAALENIAVAIIDSRLNDSLSPQLAEKFEGLLMTIDDHLRFSRYPQYPNKLAEARDTNLTVLWHLAFMTLCTDFDLLERASGRDGSPQDRLDHEEMAKINQWASSNLARRSVIHALLIKQRVESLPLGLEPAMHVPRAVFNAALCIYCYTRYRTPDPAIIITRETFKLSEFEGMGLNSAQLLFEANGNKHSDPVPVEANGCLSRLIDLLENVGHWKISRKFAVMLRALVYGEGG